MEEHYDVGLCYGNALCYNTENECLNIYKGEEGGSFEDVLDRNPIPAVTVCFRLELMQQYIREIKPITRDWQMEDYPTWLWFYKNSKVEYLPTPLACYKYSNESVSNTKNIEKLISFLQSTYDIRSYFAEKYGAKSKKSDDDDWLQYLMFCQLLNSYDRDKAKKMRKVLSKKRTLKNIVKSIIISNGLFSKIAKIFFK